MSGAEIEEALALDSQQVAELESIESQTYGNTSLLAEIRELKEEIFVLSNSVPSKLARIDFLKRIQEIRQAIQNVIEKQHALGRRCINITSLADGSKVFARVNATNGRDYVPDEEFIRLKNGLCWNIDSLLDFIIAQKGENTIIKQETGRPWPGFEAYPGVESIWTDEDDLERILSHPMAISYDFRREFYALYGEDLRREAAIVSNGTLKLMERVARLLASEGPIFEEELDHQLLASRR